MPQMGWLLSVQACSHTQIGMRLPVVHAAAATHAQAPLQESRCIQQAGRRLPSEHRAQLNLAEDRNSAWQADLAATSPAEA